MKPIETVYSEVTFKSRTEARWAVFFDAMGIEWLYEPYQYRMNGGLLYTPDFYLSQVNWFSEVKPNWPTRMELLKIRQFCSEHKQIVLLLLGAPDYKAYWTIGNNIEGAPDEWEYALETQHLFTENRFFSSPDISTKGDPRDHFSAEYQYGIEASRKWRFDGFDNDREIIRKRYA